MPPPPSPFPAALADYVRRSPWNSLLYIVPAWLFLLVLPALLRILLDPVFSPPAAAAAALLGTALAAFAWMPLYLRLRGLPLPSPHDLLPPRSALPSLFATLLLLLLASLLYNLLLAACHVPLQDRSSLDFLQTAAAAPLLPALILFAYPVLAAPVFEETLFRDALLAWTARIVPASAPPRTLRAAAAVAVLLPALLFAAIHGSFLLAPPLFLLALLLSRVAVRHGLPSAVLLHALYNLLVLLSTLPALSSP